jgi:hypothetical protein
MCLLSGNCFTVPISLLQLRLSHLPGNADSFGNEVLGVDGGGAPGPGSEVSGSVPAAYTCVPDRCSA